MGETRAVREPLSGSPQRLDLGVAAALVVITQRDVWWQGQVDGGARAVLAPLLLIATAALFWRRRAAFLCSALIAAGLVVQGVLDSGALDSLGWTLAVLAGLYSAGAYLELRAGLGALAMLLAGLTARDMHDLGSYGRNPYEVGFWWLLVVGTFGAGVYLRSRRQAAALRRVAAQTELESAQTARAAVEAERARIARELHDIVGHDVSAVVLQAEAAEAMLDTQPERARQSLHAIQRLAREALGEMRHALGIIRGDGDDVLTPQPTLADVPGLVERARSAGLPADLRVDGLQRPLPPGLEVSAFRIVQESLTNVRKHAGEARTLVTLRYEPNVLAVEVENASTLSSNGRLEGHGLAGMRERVTFFGGQFSAGPTPQGGYSVRAVFPTPPAVA